MLASPTRPCSNRAHIVSDGAVHWGWNMVARAIGKLSVFIVYSPQDGPFVFRLVEALHRKGFTTIMDDDATIDEDPHQQPVELAAADVVVFVLSPAAATAGACRREVRQALPLQA